MAALATLRAGGIVAGINVRMVSAEIAYLLGDYAPKVLVTAGGGTERMVGGAHIASRRPGRPAERAHGRRHPGAPRRRAGGRPAGGRPGRAHGDRHDERIDGATERGHVLEPLDHRSCGRLHPRGSIDGAAGEDVPRRPVQHVGGRHPVHPQPAPGRHGLLRAAVRSAARAAHDRGRAHRHLRRRADLPAAHRRASRLRRRRRVLRPDLDHRRRRGRARPAADVGGQGGPRAPDVRADGDGWVGHHQPTPLRPQRPGPVRARRAYPGRRRHRRPKGRSSRPASPARS